jgi:hypothetical protein
MVGYAIRLALEALAPLPAALQTARLRILGVPPPTPRGGRGGALEEGDAAAAPPPPAVAPAPELSVSARAQADAAQLLEACRGLARHVEAVAADAEARATEPAAGTLAAAERGAEWAARLQEVRNAVANAVAADAGLGASAMCPSCLAPMLETPLLLTACAHTLCAGCAALSLGGAGCPSCDRAHELPRAGRGTPRAVDSGESVSSMPPPPAAVPNRALALALRQSAFRAGAVGSLRELVNAMLPRFMTAENAALLRIP